MKRFLSPAALLTPAAALFGPATMALAQEVHDEVGALPTVKQGLVSGITTIVIFLLVLTVLWVKVWPTITKALDERAAKIKEEIEAAEDARRQAKEALEQYQHSLAQARAEAQKMLEQTKAQQLALAAELKAKADVELGQMRERATRDIETAKRAAITEIYTQAAALAAHVAGKILRREIRPGDNQALVDESVRQLQSTSN